MWCIVVVTVTVLTVKTTDEQIFPQSPTILKLCINPMYTFHFMTPSRCETTPSFQYTDDIITIISEICM